MRILLGVLLLTTLSLGTARADWEADQIADALQAAPPSVTHNAKIFAWRPDGTRVLVRDGDGPYTCIASGSKSLRLGKPPLPHPDPKCADQNAWAFYEAVWAESDPLHPTKPLPTAPGLVWMLAGMPVVKGKVSYGKGDVGLVEIVQKSGADTEEEEIINMTPHIMILPLPLDPAAAQLPHVYDPNHPTRQWVMAAGTPLAHLHVHFTDAVHQALRAIEVGSP